MAFHSDSQRRAAFARMKSGVSRGMAFSYVNGKKLPGTFNNLNQVFKKFPKERTAHRTVIKFQDRTGKVNVTNIK